jgi:hypothetical protein
MADIVRRPLAGAPGRLVPKKHASRPRVQRFGCPCGCGRIGFFNQPRSLRTPPVHPDQLELIP